MTSPIDRSEGLAERLERSHLAKVALAAWCGLTPDQLPPQKMWIEHPDHESRQAWERVIAALRAEFEAEAASSIRSLSKALEEAREGLTKIADAEPEDFGGYPADWSEQIAACPECQRYKDHPIQRGICDEHRRPIWEDEKHAKREPGRLYHEGRRIARSTLSNIEKTLKEQPSD